MVEPAVDLQPVELAHAALLFEHALCRPARHLDGLVPALIAEPYI